MRVVRIMTLAMATLGLAVLLVGAGFVACVAPPLTSVLAGHFADDVTSPFNREQLQRVACAARDYSFGAHEREALYREIWQVNVELGEELALAGPLPVGFPRIQDVADSSDAAQVERVLSEASEVYAFSTDTVSHLDDCNAIARVAYPSLAVLAVVGVAGVVACVVGGHRRLLGRVLVAAGALVLVALAALGLFAAIDFQRFFTLFHGVFFSQGNWQFPYDSLLICSLPTAFWAGMGAVWLVVSVLACVASVAVGRRLSR